MRIAAGELDRRITFLRSTLVDDGMRKKPGQPGPIGSRWARKLDVSDAEKVKADERGQTLSTRFLVRSDDLTRSISAKDLISYRRRGKTTTFEIVGTKESTERDDGIEISTIARVDRP